MKFNVVLLIIVINIQSNCELYDYAGIAEERSSLVFEHKLLNKNIAACVPEAFGW